MDAYIHKSNITGVYKACPSKSYLHRALICSFLNTSKKTIINNVFGTLSSDINDTILFGKALGCETEVSSDTIIVRRITELETIKSICLTIQESATTLRLIIPILFALGIEFKIYASPNLLTRPLDVYENIFNGDGNSFFVCNNYCEGKGKLKSGHFEIDGSKSSQFASGMILALALVGNSLLVVRKLESVDYVNMTLEMMDNFNVFISFEKKGDDYIYKFEEKNNYICDMVSIEGDYSQSVNILVLSLINLKELKFTNLKETSKQGDKRIFNQIEEQFSFSQKLSFDIKNSPDLGCILMILLLFCGGKIINVNRLQYKESNRITSMMNSLARIKALCKYENNEIIIDKYDFYKAPTNVTFECFNDHRVCMALTVLGTKLDGAVIKGVECINKSYPTFFDDLRKLGVNIDIK